MLRALVVASILVLPVGACASHSPPSQEPPSSGPATRVAPSTSSAPASGAASTASASGNAEAASSANAGGAASTTGVSTSASTSAPAKPDLDPATCAKQAIGADKACHWEVAGLGPCRGAAIPPGYNPPLRPTCVCNGCASDDDCKSKPHGRCETFHRICSVSARACVYPGDLCANGGALCEKQTAPSPGNSTLFPKQCTHDGHGRAVCGPYVQPPP